MWYRYRQRITRASGSEAEMLVIVCVQLISFTAYFIESPLLDLMMSSDPRCCKPRAVFVIMCSFSSSSTSVISALVLLQVLDTKQKNIVFVTIDDFHYSKTPLNQHPLDISYVQFEEVSGLERNFDK